MSNLSEQNHGVPDLYYIETDVFFEKTKQKNLKGLKITLLSKRKVSNHGLGMQWCNITVLEENTFDLCKNFLLAFMQESLILGSMLFVVIPFLIVSLFSIFFVD